MNDLLKSNHNRLNNGINKSPHLSKYFKYIVRDSKGKVVTDSDSLDWVMPNE